MKKSATCPHCTTRNIFDAATPDEEFQENLPKSLLKAGAVFAISIVNPLAGLAAGGALFAGDVKGYVDGTRITCSGCGQDFRAATNARRSGS